MQLEAFAEGIEVLVAENLADALKIFSQQKLDCVLLDWNLPDTQGLDALAQLRGSPIVVLTGMDESMARAALQGGAQDYVLKDGMTGASLFKSISYAIVRYQVSRLHEQLHQTQRLGTVGQLAAGVAHEVNNPACWIMANHELMSTLLSQLEAEHPSPRIGELRTLLAANTIGIKRITRVVSRLKTFSRDWSLDTEMQLEISRLLEDSRVVASSETCHRAEVLVQIADDLPPIFGDHSSIVHVLVNLLLNACHAIDELPGPGHVIRLSAAPWSDGVMISVEDTGPGIPAVLKDRVLEPFFTTKGRELGTGLGLSIANEVASQHGGALHIGQSPLGGAMVGLFLPTHRLADTVTEEEPLEPAELTRSLRILLIDDEPAILRALSRSLAPHAVETASSGFEALEKLERSPDFDLILCDLSMPRMNGAQVFSHAVTWDERLRERFVIVTGGAVTPELRRFIEEETVPVLQKPFSRTALQSVLRMVSV